MATNTYTKKGLIGGAGGYLDEIDGAILNDNDMAIVITDTYHYEYYLDATSGESENSPYVIEPDANAGTKRWLLTKAITSAEDVTVEDSGGYFSGSDVETIQQEIGSTLASHASDISTNNSKRTYPSGDETKVGYISVSSSVDLNSDFVETGSNTDVNAHTEWQDGKYAGFGNDADFIIYHDGSENAIRSNHVLDGDIYIQGTNTSGVIQAIIAAKSSTSRTYVQLFENATERLKTTDSGITVTGDISITGNINGVIHQIGTVSDLTSDTLVVGDTYITQGYTTEGDGGGGEYLIVSGAGSPDGYGDHSVNSGTAVATLQRDGAIDIRQFGATDGGSNTNQIAAAIAASQADAVADGLTNSPANASLKVTRGDYGSYNITEASQVDGTYTTTGIMIHADATGTIDITSTQTDKWESVSKVRNRPFIDGNRFAFGDVIATETMLNATIPQQGDNALYVIRGTRSAPDDTASYAQSCAYFELHTDRIVDEETSTWGGSRMIPALTVEAHVESGAECSVIGGAFKALTTVPVSAAGASDKTKRNVVGVSAIGQTNATSGDNWGVWGANFIASQLGSRPAPYATVGIEVDVQQIISADYTSGPTTGNSGIGYWAQSANTASVYSHTAFFASHTGSSTGWANILRYDQHCHGPMVYLRNIATTAGAEGIVVNLAVPAATSNRVLDCQRGGSSSLKVTSETGNPVYVKVNSSLKQVTQGATDSGGTGYRLLRVLN